MPEVSNLAEFQDALLELLAGGHPQHVVLDTLQTDPRFAPYKAYINGFDPDMVAVACELMGKWALHK